MEVRGRAEDDTGHITPAIMFAIGRLHTTILELAVEELSTFPSVLASKG
jgi:hypothetical protein